MARFGMDLQDVFFNLFSVLKIQDSVDDLEIADIKSVLEEFYKFSENEIAETREKGDQEGVKHINNQVEVPKCYQSLTKNYYENGWFGLGLDEKIGGTPMPDAVYVASQSIANAANSPWLMYPGLTRAALNVILQVGSEKQKEIYVSKIISGDWGGTMCLTEANAGSDVGNLSSVAIPLNKEKNLYNIKGVKIFISGGDNDLYKNIIHLVLARTPEGASGVKGLSLFIVPKMKINDSGEVLGSNDVICTKTEEKMGLHSQATCELTFGNEGNCVGELIGKENEGIINMFIMMNEARLMCGLQAEGQLAIGLELTKQYINERSQFGAAIGKHPDIKRMYFKARSISRGMRSFSLYLADLLGKKDLTNDANSKNQIESEISLLTPCFKNFSTDYGFTALTECLQMHGGYGYCNEYGIEQLLRDVKITSIYEGTNGIQAIDFLTRKVLKDEGKTLRSILERIGKSAISLEHYKNKKTIDYFISLLKKFEQISLELSKKAQENKIQDLLSYATDYTEAFSLLFVGDRLLYQANLVSNKESKFEWKSSDEFNKGKIEDWEVFVSSILPKIEILYTNLTHFDLSIDEFKI